MSSTGGTIALKTDRPEAGATRPELPGIVLRMALRDGLFLAAVVVLSQITYIGGLGLYSDDWAFLGGMHGVSEQTFGNLFQSLMGDLSTRPMQALLLAGLYGLFGLEPLGYHLVNGIIFTGTILMFYAALREMGLSRVVVLAVPLVFALLPHYSTDRFWIAAFQANLSLGLYFVSLYATLRSTRMNGTAFAVWMSLGTAALLGSVLAYEVVAPLFLLNVLIVLYRPWTRQHRNRRSRATWKRALIVSGLQILALILATGYKFTTTERAGSLGDIGTYIWNVKRVVRGAISVNFGSYVLALPAKVWRVLTEYADTLAIIIALVLGVVIFIYLFTSLKKENLTLPRPTTWFLLIGFGLVVFGMGYAIALVTFDIGFSAAGINNRTAIAAAVGVAMSLVGVIGWLSSLLPAEALRRGAFCVFTTLLCVSGFLIIDAIAEFWIRADQHQQVVIRDLRSEEIPEESVVLLDGVCPYVGPGVVFETGWDVTGMLNVAIDPTLRGDIIKANTQVLEGGIRTQLYDDVIYVYPYGENLLVYDAQRHRMSRLATYESARSYFEANHSETGTTSCPQGVEGRGVPIF